MKTRKEVKSEDKRKKKEKKANVVSAKPSVAVSDARTFAAPIEKKLSIQGRRLIEDTYQILMERYGDDFLAKQVDVLTETMKKIRLFTDQVELAAKEYQLSDKARILLTVVRDRALPVEKNKLEPLLKDCDKLNADLNAIKLALAPALAESEGLTQAEEKYAVSERVKTMYFHIESFQTGIIDFRKTVDVAYNLAKYTTDKINTCLGQTAAPQPSAYTAGSAATFAARPASQPQPVAVVAGVSTSIKTKK